MSGNSTGTQDRDAADLGRVLLDLPHSLEAEQALLGILLDDGKVALTLPEGFGAEAFFEPAHGRVFDSIKEQADTEGEVDPIIVHEELRYDATLKELGGVRYLAAMVERAPPARRASEFAKIITRLAERREIMRTAIEMATACAASADAPEDAITQAESRLLKLRLRSQADDPVTIQEAVEGTISYVQDRSAAVGVMTGLPPLDRQLGPILPEDLILLGGATGSGKSAIAVAFATNIAAPELAAVMNGRDPDPMRHRKGVVVFHMEMSFGDKKGGGQAVRRHIADLGYHLFGTKFPTYAAIRAKDVTTDQLRMMQEVEAHLAEVPIVGVSRGGLTIQRMRAICQRQFVTWERQGIEPGAIIIDHMGLSRVEKPINRYQDQTQIAIDTKGMARDLKVPVVGLVQIVRGRSRDEDKRPTINDLKDSGELENSADAILLAYRDSYYAKREKEPDVDRQPLEWAEWDRRCRSKDIEIIMGKVREGEMGAVAKVWGDVAWNAIRGHEPTGATGGFL